MPFRQVHCPLENDIPDWLTLAAEGLLEEHARATRSRFARGLLAAWNRELPKFRQVAPREMLARLEHLIGRAAAKALAGD